MRKIDFTKWLIGMMVLPLMLASCEADILPGISGEGEVVTRTLDIDEFTGFTNAIAADVYVSQGDIQEVKIEAQENIIDNLKLYINENTKIILTKTSICDSKRSKLINAQQVKIANSSKNFFIIENTDNLNNNYRYDRCHLNEIGVDLGGKVHRTLDFVRKSDPDEEVRKVATEAYKAVRRQHHKNEVDPVKGLLIAFWWLRLAQRKVLGQEVIPANATKTRRNELRYADQVKAISDDLFYLFISRD